MWRETSLKTLVIFLYVVFVFGQTDFRVVETDTPLNSTIIGEINSSPDPYLKILEFNASHSCDGSYLVEDIDYVYVEFIAAKPSTRLTFAKPGPQVIVSIPNASNLIICIKGYEDCGSSYNDTFGLPCNCKDEEQNFTAVRVKGYWGLNPDASDGVYMIIWEESVDKFLNPNAVAINITEQRQLPSIHRNGSDQYDKCCAEYPTKCGITVDPGDSCEWCFLDCSETCNIGVLIIIIIAIVIGISGCIVLYVKRDKCCKSSKNPEQVSQKKRNSIEPHEGNGTAQRGPSSPSQVTVNGNKLPPIRGKEAKHQGTTNYTDPEKFAATKTGKTFDGQATTEPRALPSPRQNGGGYVNQGFQK